MNSWLEHSSWAEMKAPRIRSFWCYKLEIITPLLAPCWGYRDHQMKQQVWKCSPLPPQGPRDHLTRFTLYSGRGNKFREASTCPSPMQKCLLSPSPCYCCYDSEALQHFVTKEKKFNHYPTDLWHRASPCLQRERRNVKKPRATNHGAVGPRNNQPYWRLGGGGEPTLMETGFPAFHQLNVVCSWWLGGQRLPVTRLL